MIGKTTHRVNTKTFF